MNSAVMVENDLEIIMLKETASTNDYVKRHLNEVDFNREKIVVADFQTQGRGQKGNSWHSEKNKNLLFSLLIFPHHIAPNNQFIISQMISLAILDTLKQYANDVKIKWPNDIYLNNRKIAGILIENNLQGKTISSSIIGVGLNINQLIFPEYLPNPISLQQITHLQHDKTKILKQICKRFFDYYKHKNHADIASVYLSHIFQLNQPKRYKDKNGSFVAKIVNILPTGHLVMQTVPQNEERVYVFKEIEFLLDNKE